MWRAPSDILYHSIAAKMAAKPAAMAARSVATAMETTIIWQLAVRLAAN